MGRVGKGSIEMSRVGKCAIKMSRVGWKTRQLKKTSFYKEDRVHSHFSRLIDVSVDVEPYREENFEPYGQEYAKPYEEENFEKNLEKVFELYGEENVDC